MQEDISFLKKVRDFVSNHWTTIRWFIIVLLLVIGAALFALWNAARAQRFSSEELAGIERLIVFAGKSAREAQKTQQNTLQSLLHTIYAICFINSAKHMVGGIDALQKLTPINVVEMHEYLTKSQMQLLSKIQQQCATKRANPLEIRQETQSEETSTSNSGNSSKIE